MFFLESKNINCIEVELTSVKNDLKDIANDNKAFEKKEGYKGWAKIQNSHLRESLKNCTNRTDEHPIAFMRDDGKPVYAFHIQNPSKTKDYYFVCILSQNILEGKTLLCGSSLLSDFVITKKKSNYLNAIPNPDHQLFVNNPTLIDYTINGGNDVLDETIHKPVEYIKKCNENHKRVPLTLRKIYKDNYDNTILEYLTTNRY